MVTARTWLRVVTLATRGGRNTASTNGIPTTPVDAFVGGTNAGRYGKPGRSTSDKSRRRRSVPIRGYDRSIVLRAILGDPCRSNFPTPK
jgi:hypothetical protein